VRAIRVGLLGCGVVGGGFVELLHRNRARIGERYGVDLEVSKILVRDLEKERPFVDRALLTTSAESVIRNGCDLVVELIGGTQPARRLIRDAIGAGKHVVTANKCVLATDGLDLLELAAIHRVRVGFEASVCGAIPIIRVLRGGLSGDRVESVEGILNGTSNYILTRMAEGGVDFNEALGEAQRNGFAEAEPSLDVDGVDAAQKLKILAELAFGRPLSLNDVDVEGVGGVTAETIARASRRGEVIKLVARAVKTEDDILLRVAPTSIPLDHPLARVRNEFNGVLLRSEAAGEMMFVGPGAGSLPSASAVLADVIELASM